jgi:hypothetical protein
MPVEQSLNQFAIYSYYAPLGAYSGLSSKAGLSVI